MTETNTDEIERVERRRDRYLKGQKTAGEENKERRRIQHARTCPECGEETFEFERCHLCGDVPWK